MYKAQNSVLLEALCLLNTSLTLLFKRSGKGSEMQACFITCTLEHRHVLFTVASQGPTSPRLDGRPRASAGSQSFQAVNVGVEHVRQCPLETDTASQHGPFRFSE